MRRRAMPQAPGRAPRSVASRASGTIDEAPQPGPGAEDQPPAPQSGAPPARPSAPLAGAPPARRAARGQGRSVRPPDPHPEGARPPDIPAEFLPRHVALVMDGNGRWAKQRGLPRTEGHRQGVESVRRTVRAAIDLGITHLTLFSFSSENWTRPPQEIHYLFGLLRRFVRRDLADLHKNGVKIKISGAREGLEADVLKMIDDAVELTKDNTALELTIAFNYGARDEIARAARRIAEDVARGALAPAAITEELIGQNLDAPDITDPDLIIRTSGAWSGAPRPATCSRAS